MANNTYEGDMTRIRDEEFDSANTKSGSENQEGGSGDEQDPHPKRKRYHRHTQHQIQEMEAFFKE
ncbi:HOMEOBOX-LEUCINE ZIPPER PROTEIN MERISTEM L1, partial [Salix koriyanagi]